MSAAKQTVTTNTDPEWLGELLIPIGIGYVGTDDSQASPLGCSYIRILDAKRQEIAYWNVDEWEEDGENVMGAIMGAICGLVKGTLPDTRPRSKG